MASRYGRYKVVSAALNHEGVDVNATDDYGYSALRWACINDQCPRSAIAYAMLTSDKVNVTSINAEDIHCALIHAIRYNHLPLVHLLLNHEKVDVNSNHQGHTALTMACYKGRLEVIRALFNDVKVDVNVKTKDGESALSFATWNGFQAEAILLLLKNDKVHVNAKEIQSVLFRAINYNHLEMVRVVLNHEKVNINAKDRDGNTALINAIRDGSEEVVRALLKHDGVDVYIKNNNGDTALICALNQKKDDVARLLEGHMKRDRRNKYRWTSAALVCAILWGCLKVLCTMWNPQAVNVYSSISNNNGAASRDCDISAGVLEGRVSREKGREEEGQKQDEYSSDSAHTLEAERLKGREEEEQNRLKDAECLQTLEEENAYCAEDEQTRREVTEQSQALEKDLEGRREDAGCVQAVEAKQEKRRIKEGEEQKRREDAERAQALEEERRRYEFDGDAHIKKKKMGWTWMILVCASFWGSWNMVSSYFAKIEQFRKRLHHVMNTTSAEPVELPLAYIERCIKKDHKLGSGAFGDVFLAEDRRLPKKFAVKMISPAHSDQDTIKEIRRSFQTELSTLKRFRHPNIIVLYGYSLNTNCSQQFLVYEYAANGSLAGFFADDGNRARLSADTRLSIMFQLVRAVHFLHTGGCKVSGKGWKVFHRDIKSANICLADDFSPRLIDCGLAEFVPDESSNAIPGTFTILVRSKAGGPAFGTPGYMCPEFARKRFEGISCPYVAAFDVFSIGVVMVEIILGCLNGGQSTRDGIQFENAFRRYVKDERDQLVVDGWEKLKGDVDRTIIWNAVALELVCKAAIQSMSPFPEDRLSTKDLLDRLRDAINLNNNEGVPNFESVAAEEIGSNCDVCNNYRTDIKCSDEGHALCATCIVDKLGDNGGCQLLCLIKGCSSPPFQDEDLYGRIPRETYNRYVEKRTESKMWDERFLQFQSQLVGFQSQLFGRLAGFQSQLSGLKSDMHGIKEDVKMGFDEINAQLQKQLQMLLGLAKGLDRSLAAVALLSADQFKECPNLVWIAPILHDKKYLENPKKWFTDKYKVVFICARSGEPGHKPFEIHMPRKWIVKIAPWLTLCLQVIKAIAKSQVLPFPDPVLPLFEKCEMMKAFLDSVLQEASKAVVARCEACEGLLENGTMSIDTYRQVQRLAGDAFKLIAEKARKEKRSQWMPPQMVPVLDRNGTPIWVKGKYAKFYSLRVNHEDRTTRT